MTTGSFETFNKVWREEPSMDWSKWLWLQYIKRKWIWKKL